MPKSIIGKNFVLFPAIILIVSISSFLMMHREEIEDIHYGTVILLEFAIVLATFVYALNVKIKVLSAEKEETAKMLRQELANLNK